MDNITEAKNALTPKSKTDNDIRESGITPTKIGSSLKKQLLFANVLTAELNETINESNEPKSVVNRVLSGKVVKKYRMQEQMKRTFSMSRSALKNTSKPLDPPKKSRLHDERVNIQSTIVDFLNRDDNSRVNPGKKDCVKSGDKSTSNTTQTRTLNDYMYNLHSKLCAEYPKMNLSRSIFYKMRPRHILLTKFLTKSSCLCEKHQNFALKLNALKKVTSLDNQRRIYCNPDSMIKQNNSDEISEILSSIDSNEVPYEEWRRVKMDDGKLKTKVVTVKATG